MMVSVREVLKEKGSFVWSIRPGATVYEALQLMADKNIGGLLVLEDNRLVGIFTERDYARKVILHGKHSSEISVSEIMTPHLITVGPDRDIVECMELMTEKRIRHLPVLEGGRIAGMISIGDVVKAIISEQKFLIDRLESYITGGR
jgi:CBS domain-containing protein